MELINKKHRDITQNLRVSLSNYFKIENISLVYFSAGAVLKFGLNAGLYVHFQNDDDRWYFYCNHDKDGFKLIAKKGKNCSLICDASLVSLIRKRTLMGFGSKFLVKKTTAEINNCPIFEIDFNHPFEVSQITIMNVKPQKGYLKAI